MARRVVEMLLDDLDGGEAAETVHFGLDGKTYEIDLSNDNATKIREILDPYVKAARKKSRSGKAFRRTAVAPDPAAVRAWAKSTGRRIPDRGRIPKETVEAFLAAH